MVERPGLATPVAVRDAPKIAEQLWTFPAPKGPKGRYQPVLPFYWGIWKFSRNKPAARSLLTYLSQREAVDQLVAALRSPAGFVGAMGSRRHVAPYLDELRARGLSQKELARVRSPVGLDLGGQRPVEIALSIAAGLVAARYGRPGGFLDAGR